MIVCVRFITQIIKYIYFSKVYVPHSSIKRNHFFQKYNTLLLTIHTHTHRQNRTHFGSYAFVCSRMRTKKPIFSTFANHMFYFVILIIRYDWLFLFCFVFSSFYSLLFFFSVYTHTHFRSWLNRAARWNSLHYYIKFNNLHMLVVRHFGW